ncbi:chaplin [Streptomyces sp. NPDC052225]|uniref:chaplin n=1 Tax=Streptomyces sp. NPDC052225 TaxID=3154949 RepID=UPI003412E246
MRQALRFGVVAAAAATGILSIPGSAASAATGDQGQPSGSAGLLSGNSIAVPLTVPVNLCGNTVDVLAAANPAADNSCAGEGEAAAVSAPAGAESTDTQGYGQEAPHDRIGGAEASSAQSTSSSGGLLAGNSVQAPVSVGLSLCGDTADVVGAANPAAHNSCSSTQEAYAAAPVPTVEIPPAQEVGPTAPTSRALPVPTQATPLPAVHQGELPAPAVPVGVPQPHAHEHLADTGADQNLLAAAAAAAGLLVGGGILYRRASASER